MTPDSYLRLDGIWKRFRRGELHDSLRDLLPALTRRLVRPSDPAALASNEFWAVRDLSFEVLPGTTLGIIGGNGAGKSTTLKILTRILRPTRGTVDVKGRIGALIEISAGFHQDLTGRENIFLQGAIMGMPQDLIREKFDEIVEFSGIAEFLDTPVKRYSSGMHARLGFSIAAHLDPDVLIIDEVLAVGDFRFQDKAFGRIRQLATSGIPVVLVSHQLDRVASLCTEAIVLDHGRVVQRGTPADCIAWYLSGNRAAGDGDLASHALQVRSFAIQGAQEVAAGEVLRLKLRGEAGETGSERERLTFRVRAAATGQIVSAVRSDQLGIRFPTGEAFELGVELDLNLRPGVYAIEPWITECASGKDLGVGPICYAQVRNDPVFEGTVHLRPRLWLGSRASAPHS